MTPSKIPQLLYPDDEDFSLYRPNVGIVVLNADDDIFVAKRIDVKQDAWQMPQGGIDEGEDVVAAAKRELFEETSISSITDIRLIPEDNTAGTRGSSWLYYDLPEDVRPNFWGGGYRGQRQKWMVCRFIGDASEINLQTAHPEFVSYKWIAKQDLSIIAVGFKINIYDYIKNNI